MVKRKRVQEPPAVPSKGPPAVEVTATAAEGPTARKKKKLKSERGTSLPEPPSAELRDAGDSAAERPRALKKRKLKSEPGTSLLGLGGSAAARPRELKKRKLKSEPGTSLLEPPSAELRDAGGSAAAVADALETVAVCRAASLSLPTRAAGAPARGGKKKRKASAGAESSEKRDNLDVLDAVLSGRKPEKKQDELLKVFVGGLSWEATAQAVRDDFEQCGAIGSFDMPKNRDGKPMGVAFIVFKTQEGVEKALEYDNKIYYGRTIRVNMSDPTQDPKHWTAEGEEVDSDVEELKNEEAAKDLQNQNHQLTVFVRGLPADTEEAQLRRDFETCGEVVAMRYPRDEEGQPKGICFIEFATEAGVKEALLFDGDEYGGGTLRISRSEHGQGKGKGKGKAKGKGKKGGKGVGHGKGKKAK